MAQLVERILGKDEVPSSTLGISTMKAKASLKREAFLHLSLGKTSPYSLLIPISQGFILSISLHFCGSFDHKTH